MPDYKGETPPFWAKEIKPTLSNAYPTVSPEDLDEEIKKLEERLEKRKEQPPSHDPES